MVQIMFPVQVAVMFVAARPLAMLLSCQLGLAE